MALAPRGSRTAVGLDTLRMVWKFVDRCADRKGLQVRLFDKTNNRTRFPATGFYRVPTGGSLTRAILCTARNKICVGATTDPRTNRQWGVGIDGNRRCSNCCLACSAVAVRASFFCFSGAQLRPEEEGEGELDFEGLESLGSEP